MKKYSFLSFLSVTLLLLLLLSCKKSDDFSNVPQGAIRGLFSVSAKQRVYFSHGNLQYQKSDRTWRFAENQYDYI